MLGQQWKSIDEGGTSCICNDVLKSWLDSVVVNKVAVVEVWIPTIKLYQEHVGEDSDTVDAEDVVDVPKVADVADVADVAERMVAADVGVEDLVEAVLIVFSVWNIWTVGGDVAFPSKRWYHTLAYFFNISMSPPIPPNLCRHNNDRINAEEWDCCIVSDSNKILPGNCISMTASSRQFTVERLVLYWSMYSINVDLLRCILWKWRAKAKLKLEI